MTLSSFLRYMQIISSIAGASWREQQGHDVALLATMPCLMDASPCSWMPCVERTARSMPLYQRHARSCPCHRMANDTNCLPDPPWHENEESRQVKLVRTADTPASLILLLAAFRKGRYRLHRSDMIFRSNGGGIGSPTSGICGRRAECLRCYEDSHSIRVDLRIEHGTILEVLAAEKAGRPQ